MSLQTKNIQIKVPGYVLNIANKLKENGFTAYLVGGALRDTLLNKTNADYDLTTNALPKQIQKIFPASIDVGIKFGTIIIPVYDNKQKKYHNIEITTMRQESDYKDFRHPQKITFINKIEQDLSRRDFTINAMAANLTNLELKQQINKFQFSNIPITVNLIDPFNGLKDLNNKIIRAVGNPISRFKEDPLRIIRACRFSAQLQFSIEEKTYQAMQQTLKYLPNIATERIQQEIVKLLKQADKPSKAFYCLYNIGALQMIIPELVSLIGVKQPIGHIHDVFDHTMTALDVSTKNVVLRLAILFHDIAKPMTKMPDGHFYGHDIKGAQLTKRILKRLKFSNAIIEQVSTLVRWHMFHYLPDIWTDSAVRRFIKKVGEQNLPLLFELRKADALSNPKQENPIPNLLLLKGHIERIKRQDLALTKKDLAVSGNDLITHLKLKPGPQIGEILNYLLEQVIENPALNKKQSLLKIAQNYILKVQKPNK